MAVDGSLDRTNAVRQYLRYKILLTLLLEMGVLYSYDISKLFLSKKDVKKMFFSHGGYVNWVYFYASKICMAIGVKIDFEDIYDLERVSDDSRTATFQTQLQDGEWIPLLINISDEPHALLPGVYNLAFGPLNDRGQIDDKVELSHRDYSKVFSTILLRGFEYLTNYPDHYIGVDGSNNSRAYYYWRFMQRNFNYLDQYFEMFGLKYYVRITRYSKHQYDNPFDFGDIQAAPDRIVKTNEWPKQMYNYFTFRKRK